MHDPTAIKLAADLSRRMGGKTFTRAHPEHAQFHPQPSPGYYADVDTPDAYEALAANLLTETT